MDEHVIPCQINYLDADFVRDRVVIFDEADYGIDNFVCMISQTQNKPMAVLVLKNALQVIFISATFDNFHRSFLKKCFSVPQIIEFKGAYQIIQQTDSDYVDK